MKTHIIARFIALAATLVFAVSGSAQGTFQNLDFESSSVPNGTQPGFISAANALPSWSVFYGANQQTQIVYNDVSTGGSQVTLVSASDPFGPNAIEGNFSVLLQGGSTATDVSIRQSSLVPVMAESIVFKAQAEGPMSLSLGGQSIPFVALSTGANYTLYGGNIPPALAGRVEQLVFSVPEGPAGNNGWNLDSIVFSPSLVPEPSTLALFCVGELLFGSYRRWLK